MVVFDNSIFCVAIHPRAKPKSTVPNIHARIGLLIETLTKNGESVVLPAPVFAEFLVLAGEDGPEYIRKIRQTAIFRIDSFDERSAIELAQLEIDARKRGNKRGSATGAEWQKVKFDRQIVSIAKVAGARCIYSDDPDIVAHGKDCGIEVIPSDKLPEPKPPAEDPQRTLFENKDGQADTQETEQTAQPVSAEVQRSDSGCAEGEAGAEGAKAEDKKEG